MAHPGRGRDPGPGRRAAGDGAGCGLVAGVSGPRGSARGLPAGPPRRDRGRAVPDHSGPARRLDPRRVVETGKGPGRRPPGGSATGAAHWPPNSKRSTTACADCWRRCCWAVLPPATWPPSVRSRRWWRPVRLAAGAAGARRWFRRRWIRAGGTGGGAAGGAGAAAGGSAAATAAGVAAGAAAIAAGAVGAAALASASAGGAGTAAAAGTAGAEQAAAGPAVVERRPVARGAGCGWCRRGARVQPVPARAAPGSLPVWASAGWWPPVRCWSRRLSPP